MALTDAQRRSLSLDLRRIAELLDMELTKSSGQRVGFSLVVWGAFGEDGNIQYVSNVEREDALRHMLELCKSWVDGMPDVPFHERQ
jgi:hypothetical protein